MSLEGFRYDWLGQVAEMLNFGRPQLVKIEVLIIKNCVEIRRCVVRSNAKRQMIDLLP